jgi:colicin import membrane protein
MARRYSPPVIYRRSDGVVSFVLSVLFHGAIVAVLASGWVIFQSPPPPDQPLAIEATAIDARALARQMRQLPPPPEPEPPAPAPPPQPTAEELAQQEQALKEQAEQEQRAAEEERQRQEQQKAAEAQATQERLAEEQRKADEERQARQRADDERKAREAAEAQKKAEEQKAAEAKKAEEKRLADQKRQQQDEQDKANREAELKQSLAQDEEEQRAADARRNSELAVWQAAITSRIKRAWIVPPSAHPGIQCVLYVTQEPGGQVSNVRIGACNGDQAVKESIQQAVFRASPLPPPSDPSLFDRNLTINFNPDGSNPQ